MGLSTPLHPDGCGRLHGGAGRPAAAAPVGAAERAVEVEDEALDLVTFYARNLGGAGAARRRTTRRCCAARRCSTRPAAPPATRRSSSRTGWRTGPSRRFQLIWPYTDLLLHDMGEGLADDRPEGVRHGDRVAHRAALGHRADRDR